MPYNTPFALGHLPPSFPKKPIGFRRSQIRLVIFQSFLL